MRKQLLSIFFLFLTMFHIGCGAAQNVRVLTSQGDASIATFTDVQLLGLPETLLLTAPEVPAMVPNNQNGEVIVPLRQDASAPFNGVLFNGPAVARISVEYRAQQQRCLIDRQHDVALIVARYNADVATLQLALDTQWRTTNLLLSRRNQDNIRLNRLLDVQTQESSPPHITEGLVWAGSGFLLGVLVVGGIVIFSN